MSSSIVGSSYQAQSNGTVGIRENRSARFTIDSGVASKGFLISTTLSLIGAAGAGIGVLANKSKLPSYGGTVLKDHELYLELFGAKPNPSLSSTAAGYCSTVMVCFFVAAGACAFAFLACQIIGNIYRRDAQQHVPLQAQPQAAEINLGRAPQPIAQPLPKQASQAAKDETSQQPTKEERLRGQVVAYDAALTALRQKVQKFTEPLA